VAVQLAKHHLADLSQQTVMVLGAGEMGGLTLQALLKQGVKQILVLSRSRERALNVTATWQMAAPSTTEIQPLTLADLPQALPKADLIIASTGATQPVLTRSVVAQAMAVRPERPLLIIDISLPRDVEASVGDLPQVHLYNLDDLENQISHGLKERAREIPLAEEIIGQEIETFWAWHRSRAVVPIITRFRDQIEDIKEEELNRTLKRMKHLDQDDQALVIELAHRLANKFMHQPTVSLKAEAAQGNGVMAADALQKLFALEVDNP
jgi:glutamyl-tRNA reductase